MSSILQALKKAEQTDVGQEKNPDSKINIQRIFNSKARYQKKNVPLNLKQLIFALGLVIIISSVTVLFFSNKKNPASQLVTHEQTVESPASPSLSQPVSPPDMPSVSQTEIQAHQKTQKPSTPVEKDADPTIFQEATKVQGPLTTQPITEPSQPRTHYPAAPAQNLFKETPKKSETISNTSLMEDEKTDFTKSRPEIKVQELEDGFIKIQAISWAETPEDRVAVINNKIVTETDFIMDYRIVQIRKDEIILDQSGQKFSLKFRYH